MTTTTSDSRPAWGNGTRTITIDPLTRVEGHGRVSIILDKDNHVQQARLHIVEFRGFERFIQGRPFWEVPVLVQRLCGICPVSHHLAAAKAMDWIVGGEKLTPTAEKIRRLMHYGQIFQSHALHFFHLSSPDLLFGFDAPVEKRNIAGVAREFPELAVQGVMMRKFGQDLIAATSGKKIHGTGAIPGGVNKRLRMAERDEFLAQTDQMVDWARKSVLIARDYTLGHVDTLASFGSFDSNHMSLVNARGEMDLYDGDLRCIDAVGNTVFEGVAPEKYQDVILEEVRSWSYMKFPFVRALGSDTGWYRVGPLARLNVCQSIDTPLAESARREFFRELGGKPVNITMAYHWARMIELLHSIEQIRRLLDDPDLLKDSLKVQGERRNEAVGIIEAPRGTLIHHYEVGDDDLVTRANLIVSTTHNNDAMNMAVRRVAEERLDGQEITEGLLNEIEVAIRAYDPCLSCATHAMGKMPLVVQLLDAEGSLVHELVRGSQ